MKQLHKYILIGILWVLPLGYLWSLINDGRYYIGGDVMIPLNAAENLKKIALWHSGRESLHYLHTFWYLYYYFFELAGISSQLAQKILIIALFGISSYFVYKLHRLLFQNSKFGEGYWPYISAFIFLYNPIHFLVVPTYLPLFGFPIVGYIFARYIYKPSVMWGILYAFALNFFFFIDLPQPKMIILFVIFALMLIYLIKISIPQLKYSTLLVRLIRLCFITIGLNLWIIFPYVYSIFHGEISGFSGQIASHNGEADLNTAQLLYIARFFNLSITIDFPHIRSFLFGIGFTFWSIFLVIIAFSPFFYKLPERLSKTTFAIYSFAIFIFFLAKGPNPPFGFIYRMLIIHIPIFRIFRTTASTIAVWVVFYSFLISLGLYLLVRYFNFSKKILLVFFAIHLLLFYPVYAGYKYFNASNDQYTTKGYTLSNEYSELEEKLTQLPTEARILVLPFSGNYVYKNWGYFGPDIIPWISGADFVTTPEYSSLSLESNEELTIFPNLFLTGVSHVLIPKDNLGQDPYSLSQNGDLVLSNNYFDLYKLKLNQPPQFYFADSTTEGQPDSVPSKKIEENPLAVFSSTIDTYPESSSSGALKSQKKYPNGFTTPKNDTIQYSILNTSHYRLKMNLQKPETLVSMDFYSKDWILYPMPKSWTGYLKLWPYLILTKSLGKHSIINGHYNAWDLDPKDIGTGDVSIDVVYYPQMLFYVGLILSSVILCCFTLFSFIKEFAQSKHD